MQGFCLGAGVDLITACDIRVASACSVFSVRETRLGLVADVGTLQRLPKILNAGHVAELVHAGAAVRRADLRDAGDVSGRRPAPAAREIRGSRTGGAIYRLAWGRERRRPCGSPSAAARPITEPTSDWSKTLVDSA